MDMLSLTEALKLGMSGGVVVAVVKGLTNITNTALRQRRHWGMTQRELDQVNATAFGPASSRRIICVEDLTKALGDHRDSMMREVGSINARLAVIEQEIKINRERYHDLAGTLNTIAVEVKLLLAGRIRRGDVEP